jgi:predicted amidophosphoribosyltransferase
MRAFKFGGSRARGWGLIFARVLLGFLDDRWVEFLEYDLIVASPAYVRRGSGSFDHTRFVILTAAQIDNAAWPFDTAATPTIVKTADTNSMKGKNWRQREEIATTELRAALAIPDASKTKGKQIIVFDDLYTTGHTLNEVARCLKRDGGAARVTGITLARQLRHS